MTTPLPMTGMTLRREHPGRQQVQRVLLVADDHRVTGVVAALVPDDVVDTVAEQVGRLALALVAPLGTIEHDRGHCHSRLPHERKPLAAQARQGLLRTESTRTGQVEPSPAHDSGAAIWQHSSAMSDHVNLLGEPPATLLPPHRGSRGSRWRPGAVPDRRRREVPGLLARPGRCSRRRPWTAAAPSRPTPTPAPATTAAWTPLRRSGWKGPRPGAVVATSRNRGFLRCLAALATAAGQIGETDEEQPAAGRSWPTAARKGTASVKRSACVQAEADVGAGRVQHRARLPPICSWV